LSISITSGLHVVVIFGQYAYAGYSLNRPGLCRKFIPEEGTFKFAEFLKDPDQYHLKMLPKKFEMTIGVALAEVLSRHTSDELYLGQRPSEWTDNEEVQQKFEKFNEELQKIEKKIKARNKNPELKNRQGEREGKKKKNLQRAKREQ
jgi:lipoxygenase